ncbi:hypothetical protein DFH29DRAFT_879741 [Suillus ampliporus]|nr:hypothetical protein DFH29DRAFT_879741 [Suillus ampliporus]
MTEDGDEVHAHCGGATMMVSYIYMNFHSNEHTYKATSQNAKKCKLFYVFRELPNCCRSKNQREGCGEAGGRRRSVGMVKIMEYPDMVFHHATNGRQLTVITTIVTHTTESSKPFRDPFDQAWADSLLEWWNMSVFDVSDNDNEEEDDLISMRKQFPSKGSTPSDLNSDKSMMDTTSTPATMPPPIEEPTPPPARAIPKPHPVKPTPRKQVLPATVALIKETPARARQSPVKVTPWKQVPPVVMAPIKETPARARWSPVKVTPRKQVPPATVAPIPSGSRTGTQTSKKCGRSNVVESDSEISELTEEEPDAPAPSKMDRAGLASAHALRPIPDTRGQELRPELPEDRGQSPVVGGSGLEDRGQSLVIGGSGPEDLGLGIVSTWVEGRQSQGSNDIGSKTRGPEAREPVDPEVGTNRRAREPASPWRKGQEIDKGTSPRSSE